MAKLLALWNASSKPVKIIMGVAAGLVVVAVVLLVVFAMLEWKWIVAIAVIGAVGIGGGFFLYNKFKTVPPVV